VTYLQPHCQHGAVDVGRSVVGRLEAVAMIEPLGRAEVAMHAGVLDAPVGIQQLGTDDADVVL
jgi:hypothetical protein